MKEYVKILELDKYEIGIIINALNDLRNKLINEDREAEKREKSIPEKSKEQQLEDLLAKKPMQTEETSKVNFNMAKTEKDPLSEPSSTTSKMQEGVSKGAKKPSVKKELAELKVEAKRLDEQKSKEKVKVNIAPVQNNKKAKAKSSR